MGHAGRTVIHNATAHAAEGDRVLIVGGNGAGKSTLLATLAGLLPAQNGNVRVLGLDPLAERRRLHEQTGHLGHAPGFYPELTGTENLTLHARVRGLGDAEVDRQLSDAGLLPYGGRPLSEYSHGMQRRLGLAKALLGEPRLLLLDEPDSGLDQQAHARLQTQLGAGTGRTVLMATHNPHAHLGWATKAWVLTSGRLTEIPADDNGVAQSALDAVMEGAP